MALTPSSILWMPDIFPWISMVIPSSEKKRMATMRNTKTPSTIFFAIFVSPSLPAAAAVAVGEAFFLSFFFFSCNSVLVIN